MYVPSKWQNLLTDCTPSNGMSAAEVLQCKAANDHLFLKSIDAIYANTTFSVNRERQVMQWLDGKLNVPKVVDYAARDNREYLLMSAINGTPAEALKESPEQFVAYLAACINQLQSLDITDCPFNSRVDTRLAELDYLLQNGLVSLDDWEPTTNFSSAESLYQWLCDNKPLHEELVFSHGDLPANFFVSGQEVYFYDLGRAGIADKWVDIAFCVSDIRDHCPGKAYEHHFFELLGVEPDEQKIEYFLLLAEMF